MTRTYITRKNFVVAPILQSPALAGLYAALFEQLRDEADIRILLTTLHGSQVASEVMTLYAAGKLGTAAEVRRHLLAGDRCDTTGTWQAPQRLTTAALIAIAESLTPEAPGQDPTP